ncbi:MAG: NADH-quinone oxidoreductase subunit NuoE [Parasporobacterium sp.]|nr:NADH-quinone oxidoreductase subunit NuoE [Parasporobacterium sp.]
MSNCSCKDDRIQALDAVLEECGHDAGNLITILQNAQEIYGYLPSEIIYYVAAQTGVSPARVMGVATFYSQFRLEPVGKYLIMLCKGTACHVNGADTLEDVISNELGITNGQTTKDGLFSLKTVACLGCCSLSPVMMINDEVFGLLTSDKVISILNEFRNKAEGGKDA